MPTQSVLVCSRFSTSSEGVTSCDSQTWSETYVVSPEQQAQLELLITGGFDTEIYLQFFWGTIGLLHPHFIVVFHNFRSYATSFSCLAASSSRLRTRPLITARAWLCMFSGSCSIRRKRALISSETLRSDLSNISSSVEHPRHLAIAATLSAGGGFLSCSHPMYVLTAVSIRPAKAFCDSPAVSRFAFRFSPMLIGMPDMS